jgi:hypothetical protein
MLDGNAAGFDKGASYTTLQLCTVVLAEADAQFSQQSLNKLLLDEEALTPISSQLTHIAQPAHQRFARAAVHFTGQRYKQVPRGPLASVWAAILFIMVGRFGASCVCRSAAEGA